MKYNINPFINNLYFIKEYGNNEMKIIIQNNKLIHDTRYFQGLRRYLDDSGNDTRYKIDRILLNTYNHIFVILQIKYNNYDILLDKIKLYVNLLESMPGLLLLCKKYELNWLYSLVCDQIKKIKNLLM